MGHEDARLRQARLVLRGGCGKVHAASPACGAARRNAQFGAHLLVGAQKEGAQFVPQLLQFSSEAGQGFGRGVLGVAEVLQFALFLHDAVAQFAHLPLVVGHDGPGFEALLRREALQPGVQSCGAFFGAGRGAAQGVFGKGGQGGAGECKGADGQEDFQHTDDHAKSGQGMGPKWGKKPLAYAHRV